MIGSEGANAGAKSTSTVVAAAIKGPRAANRLRAGPLLGLALALLWGGAGAAEDNERPTPSGYPVPRYVSIKVDPARARAGPSEDHRVLWVYHARGLPVQVVAETQFWRRICDPEGGLAWVHSRVTDGRRTVMQTQPRAVALHASPKAGSRVKAYMAPRSLGALDRCSGGWCKIKAGSVDGWVPEGALWGTAPEPQCAAKPVRGSVIDALRR